MKLKDVENLLIGLKHLYEKELPMPVAYKISKNIKLVEEEYRIINEKKGSLIKKYGKKDNNGDLVEYENGNVKINDIKSFENEIEDLMNIESCINLFKVELDDLSSIKISPKSILFLSPMLDFEEKQQEVV